MMRLRDVIEAEKYWIKCSDIYEQRKLMIELDNRKFKHNDMKTWKNEGDLFQSKFYEFNEDIYFNLTKSHFVYWKHKNNIEDDRILNFCEIDDISNIEFMRPNKLLSYSMSPKEVNDTINKVVLLEDDGKEKFLLGIIKELVNKVNYLESYITTSDIKQKERISKQEEDRVRNINTYIRADEEFYKKIYYMSPQDLTDYVRKHVPDGLNRPNEFSKLRRMACKYMGSRK